MKHPANRYRILFATCFALLGANLFAATQTVSNVTVDSGESLDVSHDDAIQTSGTVEVKNTGQSSFLSTTKVTLKPGFKASPTAGGIFVASIDSDEDGLPDAWEIANSLNHLSATGSNGDADSDGLLNLLEYLIGTNPQSTTSTSSSSVPLVVHEP